MYQRNDGFCRVYEGGAAAIVPIMDSIKKSGSVRRLIFTSSFAAVGHPGGPAPGKTYTEDSWAFAKNDEFCI